MSGEGAPSSADRTSTNGARGPAIVAVVEDSYKEGPLAMTDGIGLAERLLGLHGVVVTDVVEEPGEVVVHVETTKVKAYCPSCRRRAESQDRVYVQLRDLPLLRPAQPAGGEKASVALQDQGLHQEDLDREDRRRRLPSGPHASLRHRGDPSGGPAVPVGRVGV